MTQETEEQGIIAEAMEKLNSGEPLDDNGGGSPFSDKTSNPQQNPEQAPMKVAGENGEEISQDSPEATDDGKQVLTNPFMDESEEQKPSTTKKVENQAPTEIDEGVIFNKLSEITGGIIKTKDDLTNTLSQYQDAVTKLNQPRELQFPNERAKELYELAVNQDNLDGAQASFYKELQIMSIDSDKINEKEALYQAFLMDPKNQTIPEDQRRKFFDVKYKKTWMGLEEESEDYEETKIMYDVEVAQARAAIKEAQNQFVSKRKIVQESPVSEEQQKEIDAINGAIDNFWGTTTGIDFDFNSDDDNPDEDKIFKQSFEPEKKELYRRMAKTPNLLIQEKMNQFIDNEGNFDAEGWNNWIYLAFNVENMLKKMQDFGYNLSGAKTAQKIHNATVINRNVSQSGVFNPEPKSLQEAWGNAIKKQN